MTSNIHELSHLSKEDVIGKFNGEYIAVYDEDDVFCCKGTVLLDLFNYARDKFQGNSDGLIKVTVKDLDADMAEGNYILKSVLKIEDNLKKQ